MKLSRIFSSKLFIFVNCFFLLLIGINLGKGLYRKYQIQKEIDSMKSEVENLKSSNDQLGELISYFQTENFAEIEARKKLNMQKEDEEVVVVNLSSQELSQNSTSSRASLDENFEDKETVLEKKEKKSNIRLWFEYFFK